MTVAASAANQTDELPQEQFIYLRNVSWNTYEMLLNDLAEQHVFLTYDRGELVIDRRGNHVGVLEPIRWKTYEALLRDLDEENVRLTYDSGRLWIVSPTLKHDRVKSLIGSMLQLTVIHFRIPILSCGSATWRRAKASKGLEPDECYYVQHEPAVRRKDKIDLRRDPPPDLAIEVEVTHHEIDRLKIYAALGVSEVWHHRKGELRFLKLKGRKYVSIKKSAAFPMLKPADLDRFLEMRHSIGDTDMMVRFQQWLATLAKPAE
jgi:Uma2 family endonuclease